MIHIKSPASLTKNKKSVEKRFHFSSCLSARSNLNSFISSDVSGLSATIFMDSLIAETSGTSKKDTNDISSPEQIRSIVSIDNCPPRFIAICKVEYFIPLKVASLFNDRFRSCIKS